MDPLAFLDEELRAILNIPGDNMMEIPTLQEPVVAAPPLAPVVAATAPLQGTV